MKRILYLFRSDQRKATYRILLSWAGFGIEKSVARLQQIEYNGDESLGMQREADPLLETHPGAAGLLRWASHNFCTCSPQGSPDSNSKFVPEVELPLSFLKSTAEIIRQTQYNELRTAENAAN